MQLAQKKLAIHYVKVDANLNFKTFELLPCIVMQISTSQTALSCCIRKQEGSMFAPTTAVKFRPR